ncbi:MAG TPA: glycosyltransferase family 39 protein [Victivallales bacterium]|nr:glycosyltransferase family 39 protein [Victivallales bacterium]
MKKIYKDYYFAILTIILLAISLFLHLWQMGKVPNGFFIDESSIGYNAYSILKTGRDEYGILYPLFFRAFDNYQDPVMVYCLVPFLKFFGLNKAIVRLPSAIFHIFASLLFALLVYEYLRDKLISILSAFYFSVLPWSFCLSRTVFSGYTPMLLGLTGGVLFLLKAFRKRSIHLAIFSAIFFAFAMYSHNCGRPIAAIMILSFLIVFNKSLIKRWKIICAMFLTLSLLSLPIAIAFFYNPACLTARFKEISLYHNSSNILEFLSGVFIRYLEYFSPIFLFFTGDNNLRHNTGVGQLYIFLLPLFLLGIYFLWKKFKNPYYSLIFLFTLTYPFAAVLTKDHFHGTRTVNGTITFTLISAMGLKFLYLKMKKYKWFEIMLLSVIVFSGIEIFYYLKDYFGGYVERSRGAFNAPLVEIIESAFYERKENETIYISSSLFHHPVDKNFKPVWYSHFLFLGKIEPAIYQHYGIPPEIVSHYSSKQIPQSGLLLRMNTTILFDSEFKTKIVVFNNEKMPESVLLLKKIPLIKDSNRFFELYRF